MYVPLFADIITAERWLMIMPKVVLSNFLIYCVINAFTPGPGNILALNTVTNYGYKKGKPLFFGIFAGYYVIQILCAIFIYGVNSLLPNAMEVMKYIGEAYILWLAIHIAFSKPSTENAEQSASFLKGFRLVSALAIFLGAGMEMSLLWDLSDVLMGVMALINIPVILILSGIAFKAIQDYEAQLKQGINAVFKSADIGLRQQTDFWS